MYKIAVNDSSTCGASIIINTHHPHIGSTSSAVDVINGILGDGLIDGSTLIDHPDSIVKKRIGSCSTDIGNSISGDSILPCSLHGNTLHITIYTGRGSSQVPDEITGNGLRIGRRTKA